MFVKHLNLQKSLELDDEALGKIGATCHRLESLNISNCQLISDNGISKFFQKFCGVLTLFDLSGCILCGGPSALILSGHAENLETLKLNGLSRIPSMAIQTLFFACKKLKNFEMAVELRTVTRLRKSMIPHVNDAILREAKYSSIEEVRLQGAVYVTDLGAIALCIKCPKLRYLDLSYCNGISDKTLRCLAIRSRCLQNLLVMGCNQISDDGNFLFSFQIPTLLKKLSD